MRQDRPGLQHPGPRPARRRRPGWVTGVAVALLVTPLLELYVILQAGELLGPWPTVVLLLVMSALGAYLVRREGPATWRRLRGAMGSGRMPTEELLDAALLLVGATLLLTPGFVTDLAGLLCMLPFTRPVARGALLAVVRRRVQGMAGGVFGAGRPPSPPTPGGHGAGRRSQGDVVPGEVVGDDDGPHPRG